MPLHVALLFNGNKIYDREVIAGVGSYLATARVLWNLFLEDDYRCRLQGIGEWWGDGVIADFDDPDVHAALLKKHLPVVAVGGSYLNETDYPDWSPYVCTDNQGLVRLAYEHLVEVGLRRLAFFSMPPSPYNRWAQEREKAFGLLAERDNLPIEIYRGSSTSAESWNDSIEKLICWLQAQRKPIGIVAVNDTRARHVIQACLLAGIPVPEEVALVGIDNDPLSRHLTRVPITSVIQGTHEMGRVAASLLQQMLQGARLPRTRIVVPPVGIEFRASSEHERLADRYVMRARYFIRQHAALGVKTDQVADYVGLSRSSLESRFRKELDCTVHEEVLRFRLDLAKSLLCAGGMSTADIAFKSGFTSAQYLHAVFRRELGCTPREYRLQARTAVVAAPDAGRSE